MPEDDGIRIVLNGTATTVPQRDVTFEQLTELAFPDVPRTDTIDWEVDYREPDDQQDQTDHRELDDRQDGDDHRERTDRRPLGRELRPGETLMVTRGMVIDVGYTDKS